jgi:AraC-like DNA-binding protein
MLVSGGRVRIDSLSAEVGWSRRRLWSRFHSQIGLPPKRAAMLIRFDRAVHRLAAGVHPARVAAEGGYADQSHLHREVAAFTGLTPTTVADEPWLAVDDIAWSGALQQKGTTPVGGRRGSSGGSAPGGLSRTHSAVTGGATAEGLPDGR